MEKILKNLDELYSLLPPVPCHACGNCCVSPTSTLIEFVGLMRYAVREFDTEELEQMLFRKPVLHPDYDGNTYCCFQEHGTRHCLVHPARTMACRLFGLPVLNDLSISNLENCSRLDISKINNPTKEQLEKWLIKLTEFNREAASFYCEPYWISGFNIECWLAVYFDPTLNDGVFGELKNFLHMAFDISSMKARFVDYTGLKDKADRIALLYMLIGAGNNEDISRLIKQIREEYPYTGTYYLEELDKLEKMIAAR